MKKITIMLMLFTILTGSIPLSAADILTNPDIILEADKVTKIWGSNIGDEYYIGDIVIDEKTGQLKEVIANFTYQGDYNWFSSPSLFKIYQDKFVDLEEKNLEFATQVINQHTGLKKVQHM